MRTYAQQQQTMKQVFLGLLVILCGLKGHTQIEDPVKWIFTVTKKSDKVYEIKVTANLQKPWHIYSQNTPEGGPLPTSFTFKTNPLITVTGTPKETGKLLVIHDKNFGVDVKYYSEKVEFVQTVTLKADVKTNITGYVEFMVCNDEKCLPPKKAAFDIKLQ